MLRNQAEKRKTKPAIVSLLVAVAAFVVLLALMAYGIAPERYDLKVGEVSKITITASKDVEDTVTTQQLVEQAHKSVPLSYQPDQSVMPEVMRQMNAAATQIDNLPELRKGMDGQTVERVTDAMVDHAEELLAPVKLTDEHLRVLIQADTPMLSQLSTEVLIKVRDTLNGRLIEEQEEEAIQKIRRDLSSEGFPDPLIAAYMAVVKSYLRPNMLLDVETTEANRQKAMDDVEPLVYKMGQNIVRAGEVITAPQIEMLNALGMLKDRAVDLSLFLGMGILLVLLGMVIWSYLWAFERTLLTDSVKISLIGLIFIIVIGCSLLIRPINSYLMPVALGAMLTTLLLKSRIALIMNLVLAILAGLLASTDSDMFTSTMFCIILTAVISGSAAVVIIRSGRQRFSVLFSGMIVGLVNMTTTVAVALINSTNLRNIAVLALFSGGSGLLSAVLCIGIQPALEWVFNIETNAKLADLSNPNQLLLRRLMMEAPGTYHHSMIVANLSEAAAGAVGADALLARVGAYYHDIGKLRRPMYFKENQINDNPHDRTDPRVSTAILTAHPRDGVEIAQKARMPLAIQEIIMQHHGDTPVLYFYDKAVKQGGEIDIQDFRYDGPRPKSPEAAIIMLADTIEAAARAMTESTPETISQLIQRLVRSKLEDGQLDRCALTFHDLNRVCEAFLQVLSGVYHERIEYPEVSIPERDRLEEGKTEPAVEKESEALEGEVIEEIAPDAEPISDALPEESDLLEHAPSPDPDEQAQMLEDEA